MPAIPPDGIIILYSRGPTLPIFALARGRLRDTLSMGIFPGSRYSNRYPVNSTAGGVLLVVVGCIGGGTTGGVVEVAVGAAVGV